MSHSSMVGDCQKLFCAMAYVGGTATIRLFSGHKATTLMICAAVLVLYKKLYNYFKCSIGSLIEWL